jgi:hypothetical protein
MAYGTGKNREDMEDRQIRLICPVPTDNGRNGCFPKSAFKPIFEGLKTVEILCILVGRDVTACPACGVGKIRAACSLLAGAPP